MRSPLERYAGTLAVSSADLGARLALVAVAEMLYEAGMNEAAEMVSDHGEVVVAKAFATLAWSEETLSTEVPTAPAITPQPAGKETA